jgi:hypothetical protein
MPQFNVLMIFNVTPSSLHLVCPVASTAVGKRLTLNGFWHRAQQDSTTPLPSPKNDPVSPPVYGAPAPRDSTSCPLYVL